jgi:hypothetical protein
VPLRADREVALVQITRVVQDQHPVRVAERVDDIAAHVVTHTVCVPDRLTQQPLHRARRTIPGLFRQLPTRTGVHIGQQPEQERPSRNARACRRGSTRPNRPAIAANPVSNSASHCSTATLCPAATARYSIVSTSHR